MEKSPKVAIVHEMLIKIWGAEKVLESFMQIYPKADIFTLMYDEKKVSSMFPVEKIHESVHKLPSQKLYNITKKQRLSLPLMARSVEQIDLRKYDLVIVSSSGFAHGVITKPETTTLVYYHSPARYLRDWTNEYKSNINMNSWITWYFLNKIFLKLRIWDVIASKRHDITVANSRNTARRIQKYYKKHAHVLYPPVETERFQRKIQKNFDFPFESYYIIVSALTEFKRIEIAIDAFNSMPDKNLIIVGVWNFQETLEKRANKKNVFFAWAKYGDELVYLVQNSQGLIFPGEEDFGIVPVEALAAGKPIFALWKWGLLESVQTGITWDFFYDAQGKDFIKQFIEFDKKNQKNVYNENDCRQSAEKFSKENFEKNIKKLLYCI